jgi:hypothetical protein
MKLKFIYLALAVIGLILPLYQFMKFLMKYGFNLRYMIELVAANYISRFLVLDLMIAAFVFLILAVVEGRRAQMKNLWIYFLTTLCVGLSFSLPLFLYFREIKKENLPAD